ncbi:MAG: hypothetical protein HN348_35995, partial [Proteobacteria bacterium]|nr:hypothetical protein [Pseudomonadota bacterium]
MAGIVEPREGLKAKDIPTRAAAIRELKRIGQWDDVGVLVEMAKSDRSLSVRIYAAAAASNILIRERNAKPDAMLSKSQREQVRTWLVSIDPASNPGLLMLLAGVADKWALDRLARLMRDLRAGVRDGAVAAFRRLVLTAHLADEKAPQGVIRQVLAHRKTSPDVSLGLIGIIGEVGWDELRDVLPRAACHGRPHPAAVELALERLSQRNVPQCFNGLWRSDGLDVLEEGDASGGGW